MDENKEIDINLTKIFEMLKKKAVFSPSFCGVYSGNVRCFICRYQQHGNSLSE